MSTESQTLGPRRTVVLADAPQHWVRRPRDLLGAVISLLGIVFVALLTTYASTTTLAVTMDMRSAAEVTIQTLLFIPVKFVEGMVFFAVPCVLVSLMLIRRRWRTLATMAVAGIVAAGASFTILWISNKWWPDSEFADDFASAVKIQSLHTLLPYITVISAILVVAGALKDTGAVKISRWILAAAVTFSVIQGNQTLTGAFTGVLLGQTVALTVRWIIGTEPDRATLADLVALVRKAGIDVTQIIRLDYPDPGEDLRAWNIVTCSPLHYSDISGILRLRRIILNHASSSAVKLISEVDSLSAPDTVSSAPHIDAVSLCRGAREKYKITRTPEVSRIYLVTDHTGKEFHLFVLDEDRRIMGILEALRQKISFRAVFRQTPSSLNATAQQIALMYLQTEHLGITPRRFTGMADSDSSVVLAIQAPTQKTLADASPEGISDGMIDALWQGLENAHRHGLSHGDIRAGNVILRDPAPYLEHWDNGSAISPETARQIDLAQLTAMLAGVIGTDRAVDAVTRNMPLDQIVGLAPFLQQTIMPAQTRAYFAGTDKFRQLREELAEKVPETENAEPVALRRFSLKTILTVTVGVAALGLLLGSMNFTDVKNAVTHANPLWMALSFAAALLTYPGAGLTLKAYTKENIRLGETILVQIAASVVTLVAPAGIGPAALNLRFLQRRGVSLSPALATVSLVQVAQFVTTVILLLVLSLGSGQLQSVDMPAGTVIAVVAVSAAAAITAASVPKLRVWLWEKLKPTLSQIWPRMIWLGTHPRRILLGFAGSILMTASFVACFGFALQAFGYTLPLITLALTYLLANSVGSAVPSPGGIGPVEAALTGGLALAGIPYSVAFSAAVLYRFFTFWGRVPLGWIALRIAGRKNII